MKYRAYVGTYAVRDSEGIYLTEFDAQTGEFKILSAHPAVSPSYLASSSGILFAALEHAEFDGGYKGGAASYTIQADGSLSLLSAKPTCGAVPCHVCLDPTGDRLFVSNYVDGTLSAFDIKEGVLGEVSLLAHSGHGPNEMRQTGPHVHCAQVAPDEKTLWVVDLGIDRIISYDMNDLSEVGRFATEPGSGPRHIVFPRSMPFAWLVCELSNEVYAFERHSKKSIGIYSTLPLGFTGQSACAAIKFSPDERYLYVSNRGHDSIACYGINPLTGELDLLAIYPTGGHTPRDFSISPDGEFLFVANQDSDCIHVFKLENGVPVETGIALNIPSPACVLFYQFE